MKQTEVIKRISDFIEYDEMVTPSAFANKAGIDPSGFSKMLKGQLTITTATLKKISTTYGLSLKWLTGGTEPQYMPSVSQTTNGINGENLKDNAVNTETRPRLPMYAAAGSLSEFATSTLARDCEQVPVIRALPNYDYTMIIKGDSMEPKFEGGDEIAIRKVNDIIEWGKVYVLDTSDGAVVKRLYDDGDKFRCVSYNDSYPDFMVSKENVFGVYKVVGLIRYEL